MEGHTQFSEWPDRTIYSHLYDVGVSNSYLHYGFHIRFKHVEKKIMR